MRALRHRFSGGGHPEPQNVCAVVCVCRRRGVQSRSAARASPMHDGASSEREVLVWSPLGQPAKTMSMRPSPTGPAAVPLAPWKRNWRVRDQPTTRACCSAARAGKRDSWPDDRHTAPAADGSLRTTTLNSVLAIKAIIKGQDQRRKKDRT